MKILSLKCVNCGAGLEIKQDVSDFACGYCGIQQQVERSGGIVALKRVEEALDDVKLGTNRTASELAIARLQADIAGVYAERDKVIKVLRAADHKNNVFIGWGLLFLLAFSMGIFGPLWGMPVLALGVVFGSRFVKSKSQEIRAAQVKAEKLIEPFRAQIARHQSIIDSYDFAPGIRRNADS